MSVVVVKQCESYGTGEVTEKLNEGMERLGGWDEFVKPGMRVLLKVNLIGPKTSDSAAVTHCEFVRAVTRILKGRSCEVWIGDSSGGAIGGMALTGQSFSVSGLEKVAAEEGAFIKNFDREGVKEVSVEGNRLFLAKPLFEADLVINLPKLKTHTSGIYTGAVKNVFGCIPGLKKAEYHKAAPNPEEFGDVLADIHKSAKFHLHIMDGIMAMEGEGPTAGNPYSAGKLLISTDPLALDAVAAKMLGLELKDIPILKKAREKGIGQWQLDKIKLEGDFDHIPSLQGFKLPKRFGTTKRQNYGALVKIIDFLKTKPVIDRKKCKNCNVCVESCPMNAIDRQTKAIDYSKCIECMCCHELCLNKAVDLRRQNRLAGVMTKLYGGKYK